MAEKRKWRLQPNGDGIPLSLFDKPDPDSDPKKSVLSPLVVNIIAIVVTVIWATSFIADILVESYQPPTSIHVAFMVILGGIFGVQIAQGRSKE